MAEKQLDRDRNRLLVQSRDSQPEQHTNIAGIGSPMVAQVKRAAPGRDLDAPTVMAAEAEVEPEVLRAPTQSAAADVWFCVRRNANFVPRMRFKVPKPALETSPGAPWKYHGPLPRRKGRW